MASGTIVAIIPARGGSKGVPKKNIKPLGGYPLIAFSIAAAKLCPEIQRLVVSTDSPEIADIARSYDAEIPFLRPPEFARDSSPNIDVIRHALDWFKDNEGGEPDLLVQLLPTTPLRDPVLIGSAIRRIQGKPNATSLRSVHKLAEPPQKMMKIQGDFLVGFFPEDPRPEYFNMPRQTFPLAYQPNGYVEIIKTSFVRSGNGLFGSKILAFVTPVTAEVDSPEDFKYLMYLIEKKGHPIHGYLKANFPAHYTG